MGRRMQKLSVDAGFSCPNRDGVLSTGGCTFCSNDAFTPSYCRRGLSIREQIEEGITFHRRRYREAQRYLAYFQSFSNTYAPLEVLRERYEEALAHPEVDGLVIGTRPDCVDEEKLDYLAELAREKYVAVEYGIESVYDATLRAVNRGHDFRVAEEAVRMILAGVERINSLKLTTVKFHQLQLFRRTAMAEEYRQHPERFRFWEVEEYIDLVVEVLRRLRPDLVVERFASEAPPRFREGPSWGMIRNEQLWVMLEKRLAEKRTYQGEFFIHLPAEKG